jgi:hypothetical protein
VKEIIPDFIRKYPAANPTVNTRQARISPMIQGRICFPFPIDATGADGMGDAVDADGVSGIATDGGVGGMGGVWTGGTGCGFAGTGGL